MSLAQALRAAQAQGVARLDAQLLLLHAVGRPQGDRAWLLAHDADPLEPAQLAAFRAACARRCSGEPLAYLVGAREFYGLALKVDRRVLVPRPDTETLVDWALQVMQGARAPRVLDLGTGCGAIALAISRMRPDASVEGVDCSADALEVARENAVALALPVQLRQGNWLEGCEGPYDLIVGNPPYVADADPHLRDLRHEPRQALRGGPDGLDDMRRIVTQAPACLTAGGWLLLEHGWDQAAAVRELLAAAGLREVQSRRDLAGIERCSGGRRPELG